VHDEHADHQATADTNDWVDGLLQSLVANKRMARTSSERISEVWGNNLDFDRPTKNFATANYVDMGRFEIALLSDIQSCESERSLDMDSRHEIKPSRQAPSS
jgi:hypothetical protein